jgi:hypothetical protein
MRKNGRTHRMRVRGNVVTLHILIFRGSATDSLLDFLVRIPLAKSMSVSFERFVLSSRGLCDGSIPRPEKSYRLWWIMVCDLETS